MFSIQKGKNTFLFEKFGKMVGKMWVFVGARLDESDKKTKDCFLKQSFYPL